MTAPLLSYADVTPSAAESWPCPTGCGSRTYYESHAIRGTIERCYGCGYAERVTGRTPPDEPTPAKYGPQFGRGGRRPSLGPRIQPPCERCGATVPPTRPRPDSRTPGTAKPRRFCDPCKSIRLSEAGRMTGGRRFTQPPPRICACGCGRKTPVVKGKPNERRIYATATCRRASGIVKRERGTVAA